MATFAKTGTFCLLLSVTLLGSNAQDGAVGDAGTRLQNGFGFLVLSTPGIPPSRTASAKPTVLETTTEPTRVNATESDQTTEPYSIVTFWDTTSESETTDEPEQDETTTPMSRPTTQKRTTTSTTTKRTFPPKTTTTRRPLTSSTSAASTAKPTEVFEMRNTGMKFIRVSSPRDTATQILKTTTTRNVPDVPKTTRTVTESTTTQQILVESTDFDYGTTEADNDTILIAGGAVVKMDGDIIGLQSNVAYWKTQFPYYRYFMDPHMFWAENWYWILIFLLLIIFFFLIPGFFCQLHWPTLRKRLRKKWRKVMLCRKSKHEDIEKGEAGKDRVLATNDVPDSGRASAVLSTSSGIESAHGGDNETVDPATASKKSSHHSLAESGIHLQKEDDTPHNTRHESNDIAMLPIERETIVVKSLSQSTRQSSSSKERSFGFPEPADPKRNNAIELPLARTSILSQSDNGLDIGNETIIKSNPVDKNPRIDRDTTPPPLRPPKPDCMVPKAVGLHVAPEGRPRRKRQPARSRSPKKDRRQRNTKGHEKQSDRRKTGRGRPRSEKERSEAKRVEAERKREKEKKKIESSSQSLMRAAQSLEDLLDAITKLTREYPVPELPGQTPDSAPPKKPRKKTRSLTRRPKEERKSKRRNRSLELPPAPRETSGREVSKTKKDRTNNWAKEQKKLEKIKSKKRKREARRGEERAKSKEKDAKPERRKKKEKKEEKEKKASGEGEKEEEEKVPTLVMQELSPVNKTKEERSRLRLERDLKKLQKYHNSKAKKEAKNTEKGDASDKKD